jgi:hypothetical protein
MLALLLTLALAQPPDPNPARPVCLTPAEVSTRILEPLSALVRCRDEVAILSDERDGMHAALYATTAALHDERIARAAADRRTRRARQGQARAAGGGAGAVLLVLLLVVLL